MTTTAPQAGRPRAVVLVGNPAAPYSRGLRIARALASAGYEAEIAAVSAKGLPEREREGEVEIRRYRPSGPLRWFAARHEGVSATPAVAPVAAAVVSPSPAPAPAPAEASPAPSSTPSSSAPVAAAPPAPRRTLARRVRNALIARSRAVALVFPRWLLWPHTVRAWWHALGLELPPADVYHACGSLAIAPALAARDRDRRAGRRSIVIYDVIDNVLEGNNVLGMPGAVRRMLVRREAGWARRADGLTTVNPGLAERLTARWHPVGPVLVIPNYPEPRGGIEPGVAAAEAAAHDHGVDDLIRLATGLPATTRIVLFQGRLGPNLGLDESAEAVLRVPDAAFVLVGFGRGYERSVARDREPRFAGHHLTLPAVHPDELIAWTASADVSLVPLPPVSVNQRLSTPNKFWESLAAGTPVVVGPGLDLMAGLVREHDLGVVAASLAPADLGAAIRAVLDVPEAERDGRRRRIAALAAARFSWPAAATDYLGLVAELRGAPVEATGRGTDRAVSA